MKEWESDFIILDPTFSYFCRWLDNWEIAWDVIACPMTYSIHNLLSQGTFYFLSKNKTHTVCLHLCYCWIHRGIEPPCPQNTPAWAAVISSIFQLDAVNCGCLMAARHAMPSQPPHLLSPGLVLSDSWFIRWSPKLCTPPRTPPDSHPPKKPRSQGLWMKPLAILTKGNEDKCAQRWSCIPPFLKVQNLENLQSCAKFQQLLQPWGPPDLYHISKGCYAAAGLNLPFIQPLPWERVGKASAIQGLAQAGLRVLVWENFSWSLWECRLINVLMY